MTIGRCLRCALFLQMIWLLVGCCSDHYTHVIEWTGMEAVNLDNTGLEPAESDATSVPAAAYGIRAKLSLTDTPAARTSLFPTASACVDVYHHANRDTLLAIRISAISNDTADGPRDVTDDFRVLMPYARDFSERIITVPTMIEYVAQQGTIYHDRIDFIRTGNALPSPGIRFILTMELSGGKTFADTTTAIALL